MTDNKEKIKSKKSSRAFWIYGSIMLLLLVLSPAIWLGIQMQYISIYEKLFLTPVKYSAPLEYGTYYIRSKQELQPVINSGLKIYFDWDDDGFAESSAWLNSKEQIIFVSGSGNRSTPLKINSARPFDAISNLDDNRDGVINIKDKLFSSLEIFTINSDGKNPQSMGKFSDHYKAISLSENDSISPKLLSDKNTVSAVLQPAFFERNLSNTRYAKNYVLNKKTLFLPTLRGYGKLPDLHIAMSQDPALLQLVTNLAQCNLVELFGNPEATTDNLNNILFRWAGVDAVDPRSRGPFIDARTLQYLEKLLGIPFFQKQKWHNPRPYAAEILQTAWDDIFVGQSTRLIIQSCGRTLFYNAIYNPVTDELNLGSVNQEAVSSVLQGIKKLPRDKQQLAVQNLKTFMNFANTSMQPLDRTFLSFF